MVGGAYVCMCVGCGGLRRGGGVCAGREVGMMEEKNDGPSFRENHINGVTVSSFRLSGIVVLLVQ
jgi:hypothetical protein